MKKKLIIAIIVAIVVIGGCIGGYMYHFSQVKAEKMANYKKALSDYRFNSNRLIINYNFSIPSKTTIYRVIYFLTIVS